MIAFVDNISFVYTFVMHPLMYWRVVMAYDLDITYAVEMAPLPTIE